MRILFSVNPISGGVDKEPFLNWATDECKRYGWEYLVFKTTGNDDEDAFKGLIHDFNPTRIASVGGDGTTLFNAVCLIGSTIPMGIIPLGSANGMAAELFVNSDPKIAFQDFVLSNVIASLDLIKVNKKHYCLHIGDVGINAQIVKGFSEDASRGMLTYAKHFFAQLSNTINLEAEIIADGVTYNETGVMIALANARKYGTGVLLNPIGNPFDGKFEIVVAKDASLDTIIKSGLTWIDETFADEIEGVIISCKEAVIKLKEPTILQLDGEVIGECKEIHAEILPACVLLISHQGNSLLP